MPHHEQERRCPVWQSAGELAKERLGLAGHIPKESVISTLLDAARRNDKDLEVVEDRPEGIWQPRNENEVADGSIVGRARMTL
jgi:hypothetical protein